jgi:hypothetical protein
LKPSVSTERECDISIDDVGDTVQLRPIQLRRTDTDARGDRDMNMPQQRTARAEGGTHDGEEFDITEETVGLVLTSRSNPVTLEYYELVLYMRGNLLRFVREYDRVERRLAFGGTEPFGAAESSLEPPRV